MKDLVKSILEIINKICTTDSNEGMNIIYDKDDMDYLLEKCKLLEYTLDNQYFTNLVSDLETNIEYNTESIYIYNILTSLKLYFNHSIKKKQLLYFNHGWRYKYDKY